VNSFHKSLFVISTKELIIIIIITNFIRTKSTNTKKQLTQRYKLSAENEPSAKKTKRKKRK